jgi:hypothetical protein
MNKEKNRDTRNKNINAKPAYVAIALVLIFAAIGLHFSLSYNTRANLTDQSLRKSLDHLYENQSTAAKELLSKIDTSSLSPRQKALYQLSLAYLHFQEEDAPGALELLDNINYNEANHLPEETIAEINLINAIILEQTFLADSALVRYNKAINYFDHHKEDLRYFFNALGMARTSKLPAYFLQKAETYLKKNATHRNAYLFYHTAALLSQDNATSKELFEKALYELQNEGDEYKKVNVYMFLCNSHIKLNQLDSCIWYFEKAREIMQEEHKFSKTQLFSFTIYSAFINYLKHDIENGLLHLNRAKELAGKNPGLLMEYYQQKANYERAAGNKEKELFYIEKYLEQHKNYFKNITQKQATTLQSVYKSERIEESKKYFFNPFSNLYFMLILLAVSGIFIMYYINLKYRWKLLSTQTNARNPLPGNRQGENLLYIDKKNIANPEKEISDHEQTGDAWPAGQEINGNKPSWDVFYHRFNNHYPGFEDKLKSELPNLSEVNRRYCFCVMCNLPNQEVIEMLGISADAYKKAKKRLRDIFGVESLNDLRKCLDQIQQRGSSKSS